LSRTLARDMGMSEVIITGQKGFCFSTFSPNKAANILWVIFKNFTCNLVKLCYNLIRIKCPILELMSNLMSNLNNERKL